MFVILYLCQAQATFDWVDLNFTIVRVLCIRKLMLIAKLIATVVLLEWKMVNRIFSPYLKRTLLSAGENAAYVCKGQTWYAVYLYLQADRCSLFKNKVLK